MENLTAATFEKEVMQGSAPVLVDFWAPWCGPCKIVGPVLEKLSSEYKNKLKFAKLNVDENQELSVKHDVRGIPCMVIFSKGREVDRIVGAFPEDSLRKKLDLVLANTN